MALFGLVIFGLFTTYRELINLSQTETITKESEELKLISEALLTLYKTESSNKMLLSQKNNSQVDTSYQHSSQELNIYLDSIYSVSKDEKIHHSIDTVKFLLAQKNKNLKSITDLMNLIQNLPYSNVMSRKVISKKAIHDLSQIITESSLLKEDTTLYIKKKKNFFGRVKSVFVNSDDSVKVVSKSREKNKIDTLYAEPTKIITDTVVSYINKINRNSDKKKIRYMIRLSERQTEMLYYDKLLTLQIKKILYRVEFREKERIKLLSDTKEQLLKKSSQTVSTIAIIALFFVLIFIVLSFIQINKVLKYNAELEENRTRINFLAKSREKLLLMISHDIKAPLSSIIGHIELLSQQKNTKEEKESLKNMRNSSEQILNLSNKLLEYHKLEKGESTLIISSFEPYLLIKNIVKSFNPIAQQKELSLKLNNKIPQKYTYYSDPFVLNQIFNNLINNAIKFTPTGGVTITSIVKEDQLIVEIKDTGVGISKKDQKQIFNEFQRVGSLKSQREIEGSGLGLSITIKLIHLLNGKLALHSALKKGSTFTVTIPLSKTENNTTKVSLNSKEISEQTQQLSEIKVLFVDDDITMLNVYSKMIKKAGAKVTICSESKKALKKAKKETFDIIFTDIQMPDMNGIELMKKIRKINAEYQQIPIIALSASSNISSSELTKMKFTNFLLKPINTNQLISLVYENRKHKNQVTANENQFEVLFEFVKDDKKTSLEIMQTFFRENNDKIKQLKIGLNKKDNKLIQSIAHKALPTMQMIQDKSIIVLLEKMEEGKIKTKEVKELITLLEKKSNEIKAFISTRFADSL